MSRPGTMPAAPLPRLVAVVLLVVGLLVACGGVERPAESEEKTWPATGPCEVGPQAGLVEHTLTVDGDKRTYRLHAPPGLPTQTRIPVVYMFHGLGSDPEEAATYTAFSEAAIEHGFLLVVPTGVRTRTACSGTSRRPRANRVRMRRSSPS